MSTSGLVKQAYCTACGALIIDGACARDCAKQALHGPVPSPVAAAEPTSKPASRKLWYGLNGAVLALAVTLASTAVALAIRNQDHLDQSTATLESIQQQTQGLQRQLEESLIAQQATAGRLATLETDLSDQPDTAATAKTAARSVFTINASNGSGSGFVVATSRRSTTLVTNFHVVAQTYVNGGRTVEVSRGDLTYTGSISDASESNDLAVITVSRRLPALQIADRKPAIGEPVLVLGSPLGLGGTVTSGIVSAFRTEDGLDYLQFSAPISPGNSGGPVVNERGEVIGVAVAKMVGQGAEGLGFAIPASRLCSALDVC